MPFSFRLELTWTGGANAYQIDLLAAPHEVTVVRSFDVTGTAIPDSVFKPPVDIFVNLTGAPIIDDLNFRFDGTVCSTDPLSSLVGLNHSSVGDLEISLRSPAGTVVDLVTEAGEGGNNFCQTRFDDDGPFRSAQTMIAAEQPFTGTFRPKEPLSAFDGEDPNGMWRLTVNDTGFSDTGSVNRFSLEITAFECDSPRSVFPAFTHVAPFGIDDSSGNGNTNGAIEPGEQQVAVRIPVRNIGNSPSTGNTGVLVSLTGSVSVIMGRAAWPDLATNGVGTNTIPFRLAVSSNHPCGVSVPLRLTIDGNERGNCFEFLLPVGRRGIQTRTNTYDVGGIAIPDSAPAIDIPFQWPHEGAIDEVQFRFGGPVCSTDPGSSQVGLNHDWVG
ncbi:MAG: proprotein convertase P-domain-containing protein, partial [Verrucomicrobiota bacterium]